MMKTVMLIFLSSFVFLLTECNTTKTQTKERTEDVGQVGSPQTLYTLSGNEPFWNVRIQGDEIVFHKMGEEKVSYPYVKDKSSTGILVYETKNDKSSMKIILEKKPCSDTMADKEYSYKATVVKDGVTYKGCAE